MADLLDRIIRLTPETVCCDWGSCLDIDEVEQLFAGRDSITLRDLMREPVAPEYLLWLVLRPEIIPETHLCELGCLYAEHVIKALGVEPDPRIVNAIAAKWAWLAAIGTPQEAVCEVAWEAASKVAREVAWEMAWEAARVAQMVAWEAARAAQVGTEGEAAQQAREAVWEKLMKITAEYLKGVSDEV